MLGPDRQPVPEAYREMMLRLARSIDHRLNRGQRPKALGFCLLMFPFADAETPHKDRLNYISNADALDMLALFKEMTARLEYRLSKGGSA